MANRLMNRVSAGLLLLPLFNLSAQTHGYPVEQDGAVVIEAENFASQHLDSKRRWLVFDGNTKKHSLPDADPMHLAEASNSAYIELLPDTRVSHHDPLIIGENFSAAPGAVAVLSYPVHFKTKGKYYVWARAYSTGSEDNGLHVGLNGSWPESGQRLQLCEGKDMWTWSSAQRVETNHCGEPHTITLEIPSAGVHNVMVSMREDGFELDKLLLTTNPYYVPKGIAIKETLSKPKPFASKKILTQIEQYKRTLFASSDFNWDESLDNALVAKPKQHSLSIDSSIQANQDKYFTIEQTITKKEVGTYNLTLVTLSEGLAQSRYQVQLNDNLLAEFTNPKTTHFGQEIYFQLNDVTLTAGDIIKVASMAVSNQDQASQGSWRALVIGTN